jgi:23S rRNA pseudouridine2605 synthase
LNRLLAQAGFGSRRDCDELIEQGRIEVDGQTVTELGTKVDLAVAKVEVDGQPLKRHKPVYYAVHKPRDVLCTQRDPQGRTRVTDLVPDGARVFPVGRLDRNSTGLILLTNDGELAQRLAHPKYGVSKTYYVVVQGQVTPEDVQQLLKGVYLAEGRARVDQVKIRRVRRGSTELEMVLSEGKNREIRRILARLGHKVVVLRRLAIGPLRLGDLPEGAYRPLTTTEIEALYAAKRSPAAPSILGPRPGRGSAARPGRPPAAGRPKRVGEGAPKYGVTIGGDAPPGEARPRPQSVPGGAARKVGQRSVRGAPAKGVQRKVRGGPDSASGGDGSAAARPRRPAAKRPGGAVSGGAPPGSRRQATKAGGPKRSGPQAGGPKRSGPQAGGPKRSGPQAGGPKRGGPQAGGPKRGGPKKRPPAGPGRAPRR